MKSEEKLKVQESLSEIVNLLIKVMNENTRLLDAISKGIEEAHRIASSDIKTEQDFGYAKGVLHMISCIREGIEDIV